MKGFAVKEGIRGNCWFVWIQYLHGTVEDSAGHLLGLLQGNDKVLMGLTNVSLELSAQPVTCPGSSTANCQYYISKCGNGSLREENMKTPGLYKTNGSPI